MKARHLEHGVLVAASLAVGLLLGRGNSVLAVIPIGVWIAYVYLRFGSGGLLLLAILLAPLQTYLPTIGIPYIWLLCSAALLTRLADFKSPPVLGRIGAVRLIALACLLVAVGASYLTAGRSPEGNVSAALSLVFGVVAYCSALLNVQSEKDVRRAIAAFAVSGALAVVLALAQLAFPGILIPGVVGGSAGTATSQLGTAFLRLSGPVGDYELFGEFAALALVASTWIALQVEKGRVRLLLVGTTALLFVGVVLSGTRGAVLIAALGVVLVVMRDQQKTGRRLQTVILLTGAGVASAVLAAEAAGVLWARLAGTSIQGTLADTVNRGTVWALFADRITASLPAWGFGPEFQFSLWQTYPHSLYLYLAFTLGPLGLVAMVVLLVDAASALAVPDRVRVITATAWCASLLVMLLMIHEAKVEYLRAYNYTQVVFLLLGVAAAARDVAPDPGTSEVPV